MRALSLILMFHTINRGGHTTSSYPGPAPHLSFAWVGTVPAISVANGISAKGASACCAVADLSDAGDRGAFRHSGGHRSGSDLLGLLFWKPCFLGRLHLTPAITITRRLHASRHRLEPFASSLGSFLALFVETPWLLQPPQLLPFPRVHVRQPLSQQQTSLRQQQDWPPEEVVWLA